MTFNTVSARTQRQLLHPSSSWAPQHPEDNHFANPKIHDHTKLLAKASLDPEFASRQAVLTTDTHERFKNVVAGFGERQCKKYRDIVYGMLGFGPWDVYLPVEVDHSRSVEEVYTDFAGAVLENKNFALFEDAAIWNRKNNEAVTSKTRIRDSSCLPSWVPERGGKTFESDIVPWKPTMINENWPYCTPIMSWPKNNRESIAQSFSAAFNNSFRSIREIGDRSDFGEQIQGFLFFVTKEGYFGFAPKDLQLNDVAVAFCGIPGPYVVRPVGGGGGNGFPAVFTMLHT
ncbi:hypothetical protein K432DRAFT_402775 [Lepidopterella palustris CBS 459.81]|uniref:Uncharacterized protein n=1 Tax=Lepidopterella palustris CBS 459.81 TaxID=1314670 RepID=A0A8E2EER7_9PEZI|nr:hypothetical protein K432DRAFT_402775 [Lepidopterella palustris CBS 459.81]